MKNKLFILILVLFLITGCTSTNSEIIYKTEYIIVEVPVMYKLERPDRPKLENYYSIPDYLAGILTYTEILEVIIDNINETR